MGDEINTLETPYDDRTYRLQHGGIPSERGVLGGQRPDRLFFICPHCQAVVEQSIDNFHYWCDSCGRNATSRVGSIQLDQPPSAEWVGQAATVDGVWHRIYIRGREQHAMRCGYKVAADQAELPEGPALPATDRFCPTCFYTPPRN